MITMIKIRLGKVQFVTRYLLRLFHACCDSLHSPVDSCYRSFTEVRIVIHTSP